MNIAERTLELKTDFDNIYKAGKEEGAQAQYDEFWDGFQNVVNGVPQRTSYKYAFYQWRHRNIYPKYTVKPDNSKESAITVDGIFESCNNLTSISNVDFSNYTPKTTANTGSWASIFSSCSALIECPDLNMKAGGYYNTWRHCSKLQRIEIMRCCEEGMYNGPFHNCTSLTDITIEGVIGNSFPIPNSPLNPTSLKSIIFHLKNYNGDATKEHKNTVTFKSSAFEALEAVGITEEDKNKLVEIGLEYSKDLTWAQIIDNLKWNLTLAA